LDASMDDEFGRHAGSMHISEGDHEDRLVDQATKE
jgi:hypothetical protein